jgi:hypothetical protein
MGYNKKSKGYTLYNLNEEKMVISRDAKYDEKKRMRLEGRCGEKYDFLPVLEKDEERYEDH